jgi:hypothetical protein
MEKVVASINQLPEAGNDDGSSSQGRLARHDAADLRVGFPIQSVQYEFVMLEMYLIT